MKAKKSLTSSIKIDMMERRYQRDPIGEKKLAGCKVLAVQLLS